MLPETDTELRASLPSTPPCYPRFVLAVCGGRDYSDSARVFQSLDRVHAKRRITILVQGGASGADRLAKQWAQVRGVTSREFAADWKGLGPAAGPRRNAEMVAFGLDGLVAFPGGRGTANMVAQCEAAGVKVWRPIKSAG